MKQIFLRGGGGGGGLLVEVFRDWAFFYVSSKFCNLFISLKLFEIHSSYSIALVHFTFQNLTQNFPFFFFHVLYTKGYTVKHIKQKIKEKRLIYISYIPSCNPSEI